jgi:hypothetical protein
MDDLYGCDDWLESAYEDANGGVTEWDVSDFDVEEEFFDDDVHEHETWCCVDENGEGCCC